MTAKPSDPRPRVVVVDDRASMRQLLETVLSLDFDVGTFQNPLEALAHLEREPADVVITDVRMPELTGLEVLDRIRGFDPDASVILITAYGTVAQAVEAVKRGAFDYVQKPFEPDDILLAVQRALEHRRLAVRARQLEREVARTGGQRLVGRGQSMQRVRALIDKVAGTDVTVLVTGPSGTGKEVVAREIHERSARKRGPYAVVHSAGVPRELLESELFGHVRGAFSGAGAAKRGMADEARGGTLFLDDINYLDLDLQAKANRLVQEKEIKPVGATTWRKVDVRIVAAANVDLEVAVREGTFREDLYYRLNVIEIALPSLAERVEDIEDLARYFVAKHRARLGRPEACLTNDAVRWLERAPWPGNVRQLENALERAIILADGSEITPAAFGPFAVAGGAPQAAPETQRGRGPEGGNVTDDDLERTYAEVVAAASDRAGHVYLEALLARYDGNVTRAAEHAGVARQHLHRLLKKHHVRRS